MPAYARLEYNDNGDLIYSDFSDFDDYIEKQFIPNHICKDDKNGCYFIRIKNLVEHQFCEEEIKYLMNYLKEKNILVRGNSSTLSGEFDNYIGHISLISDNFPVNTNSDFVMEKIIEYKKKPSLELRNEIVLLNVELVRKISLLLSETVGLNSCELESFGYEGLITAIEEFDITNGCKFSTYAYTVIKWKIITGISVLLGFGASPRFNKFYIAKGIVEKETCTYLNDDVYLINQIVDLMVTKKDLSGISSNDYKRKVFMLNADSLDKYLDNTCDENLIQDNLLSLEILNNIVKPVIEEGLERLNQNELKVIGLRYGFDNDHILKFREIGEILGVSRERARQIHNDAIAKLRKMKKIKMLKDYIEEYDNCNYNPNSLVIYKYKKQ